MNSRYGTWSSLQKVIRPCLKSAELTQTIGSFEILIPGCGSSSLGAQLYKEGYTNITNIDSSKVVINQMSDRYQDLDQMEYTLMDATNMEFIPDNCFDLVIDKALFDCVLCGANNMTNIIKLVKEMYRVLKPNGKYIMFSHSPPNTREPILYGNERCHDWSITVDEVAKPPVNNLDEPHTDSVFYVYTCTKAAASAKKGNIKI